MRPAVAIFLLAGLACSAATGGRQPNPFLPDRDWLGTLLVLLAGAFLALAALVALPAFHHRLANPATRARALARRARLRRGLFLPTAHPGAGGESTARPAPGPAAGGG